jgi:chromosomal replication initiation ATPase DnaA
MSRLLNYIANKYHLNLMTEQMELNKTTKADAATFIHVCCQRLNVHYSDLTGPRRTEPIAHIRLCVMYALATHGFTLRQCVYAVGRTNHTTAIYARDTITNFLEMGDKRTVEIMKIINDVIKETGWETVNSATNEQPA